MRRCAGLMVLAVTLATSACSSAASNLPATSTTSPVSTTGTRSTPESISPAGAVTEAVPVLRVVDGDTLHVLLKGQDVTVRILAIDTPETVKPGSPVECFGPEASQFAHDSLDGRTVTLEADPSQDPEDRYGRMLAHVWVEEADGTKWLYGEQAVRAGVADARVYGGKPSLWADDLEQAEQQARAEGVGMWGACGAPQP